MKKGLMLSAVIILVIFSASFVSAVCNLQVSLLNQDPYPAVPGDYVKLVFQVTGIDSPLCEEVYFQLVPQYPISFDPNVSSEVKVRGGAYVTNYKSDLVIPFKVRIDENAIDGDNQIKTLYYSSKGSTANDSYIIDRFELNVKNTKTIFEAFVKNFDFTKNTLSIQILNSGKSNIDALTVEIPEQEGVTVKGSNKNIIGSLDANEYTTVDFEVSPVESDINLNIYYTDSIGVRRTTNTTIHFDPNYFQNRKTERKSSSSVWVIIVLVFLFVWFLIKRAKRNKHKKQMNQMRN
jgi:hypothetical protein